MTNTSSAACTINGYGEFVLLDRNGSPLPAERVHKPEAAPSPVLLRPGMSASKFLEWTMFPAVGGPVCVKPRYIRFSPPGDNESLGVEWGALGDVCSAITEGPYDSNS